jgi:hypothetical protein
MDPADGLNRIIWLDPCPESVWELLPGGPDAPNDSEGEVWQYMGTIPEEEQGHVRHEFRHRAHPLFDSNRVYAFVVDDDAGPRLTRLIANGREVPLIEVPVLDGDPETG